MPFKSKAQQRFLFATHPKGVNLKEWSDATDYDKLPAKVATEYLSKTLRKYAPTVGGALIGGIGGSLGAVHMLPDESSVYDQYTAQGLGGVLGSSVGAQVGHNLAEKKDISEGLLAAAAGHTKEDVTMAEHAMHAVPRFGLAGVGALGGGMAGHFIGESIHPGLGQAAAFKGVGLGAALGGFAGEALIDKEKREKFKDPAALAPAVLLGQH